MPAHERERLGEGAGGMHRRYGGVLAAATLGQEGVLAWDGKQLPSRLCVQRSGGGYNRSWRYLPRRIYLWSAPGLAP